jgi:hypothetical protein
MKKTLGKYPLGVWIALGALLLIMLAWIMQAYSLIDWDGAVEVGLQSASFSGDEAERTMANKERGEAIADLLWPLPITVIAIIGLTQNKFIGFVAAMMTFAICVYFPLFYVFQLWSSHLDTVIGALILWAIPSLFGILGLWANKNEFLINSSAK